MTSMRTLAAACLRASSLAASRERREGFERKFRVDDHEPWVARQADDAIGAGVVGERILKLEGRGGQAVPDDRFEAALAEGAARLLVGENVLEADDFLGQRGDPGLRRIDHRQPFVQFGEMLARGLARRFETGADPRSDRVEPLGNEPREIGLARPQNLGDAAHRSGESGVLPRDLFHRAKHLALALDGRKRVLAGSRRRSDGKAPSHDRKKH